MGLAEKSLGADFPLGLSRMIGLNVHEKNLRPSLPLKALGGGNDRLINNFYIPHTCRVRL